MSALTAWSYLFPAIITLTILLNHKQIIWGWLLGLLANIGQIIIALTFPDLRGLLLSVFPAAAFAYSFVKTWRTRRDTPEKDTTHV